MIVDEALRMLTALTLANRLGDRTAALAEASGRLDAMRIGLWLTNRLGFLPNPRLRGADRSSGRGRWMLGGWMRLANRMTRRQERLAAVRSCFRRRDGSPRGFPLAREREATRVCSAGSGESCALDDWRAFI
jgi:hypothetical protein